MSTEVINVAKGDTATLNKLYDSSALTLEGLAIDDVDSMLDYVDEISGLKTRRAYVINGDVMNDAYGLTGSNAYPDDLHIVCVDLNDIDNVDKLVVARFGFGGRWFDDVVDNNARREEENGGVGRREL